MMSFKASRREMLTHSLRSVSAVQELVELDLHSNVLTGTLPTQWGSVNNWGNLTTLAYYSNALSGTIPEFWGASGAFPVLKQMYVFDMMSACQACVAAPPRSRADCSQPTCQQPVPTWQACTQLCCQRVS